MQWGKKSVFGFGPQYSTAKTCAQRGRFFECHEPTDQGADRCDFGQGAWSSASDSVTPVPGGSRVTNGVLSNPDFGIKFTLPSGWAQGYDGAPPSDTGPYVLTHLGAADSHTAGMESSGSAICDS
jgi:hypothetical protein